MPVSSDKDPQSVPEVRANVAALVLAAGAASRLGRVKPLLPWGASSLVRHCAQIALASNCRSVFVVVGEAGEAIEQDLADLDVRVVHHADWQQGLGSSIAAGVAALPADVDGVLILLCDQPFVTSTLLDTILRPYIEEGCACTASRYGDTLGPPAFFARGAFAALRSLEGDRGAKGLIEGAGPEVAVVDFPRGAFDIDTREDYDRALAERARHRDDT